MNQKNVLIVDDDKIILEQLDKELRRNFFNTFLASKGKDVFKILKQNEINIILLDIKLEDANGLDILRKINQQNSSYEVIVITGYGTQEIAIQSLRMGAIDYIEKPIQMEELYAALGRAQERLIAKKELSFKNTLLLIDDEEDILKSLKKILEKEGYTVFCASSGKLGLNIIEKNKIDVLITDIKMDDMNGIDVLSKAKSFCQDIEGIMVTGFKDQELAIKSLRAGAIDYLTKPINLDELIFSVNRAIERINLKRNSLYRNRELKISKEIISKMNEELERRIRKKAKELSQIQAQLFQTSKLATLGEMATGLAHEINQPLGGISLVATHFRKLLQRDKLSRKEIEHGLLDIETSVKRMSKIIQHIRTFARQDTLKFIKVNINQTIESALSLLNEQLRLHEIEVIKKLCPELPEIHGEPYQLEQVWINIIANARDAVDARKTKDFNKKIKIKTDFDAVKKIITVKFSDNGIGMAENIREKVFEPFFTTKEVGKATGLGLSISYGIIESHQGKIEVQSESGKGTSIIVIFTVGEK